MWLTHRACFGVLSQISCWETECNYKTFLSEIWNRLCRCTMLVNQLDNMRAYQLRPVALTICFCYCKESTQLLSVSCSYSSWKFCFTSLFLFVSVFIRDLYVTLSTRSTWFYTQKVFLLPWYFSQTYWSVPEWYVASVSSWTYVFFSFCLLIFLGFFILLLPCPLFLSFLYFFLYIYFI